MPTEATAHQTAPGSLGMDTGTAKNLTLNIRMPTVSAEQLEEHETSDSFQANCALK